MDQHDNLPEQLHRTSEDKLSKPRLRGQLLHPDELHSRSLLTDSSPSRFGGMRLGIEESVVGLLIYFPLLALLRWVFGRRGHSIPAPLGDQANKSRGDLFVVKYAATTTIRQDLRTAIGSRANGREESMVLGSSSVHGVGHDMEHGASAPISPRPRPPLPPLSIDEVLQKSVWGFREKWWPMSSTAAFEAARIEEAEGNVGGIRGFEMHPGTKAFLDKYVYSHPLCISISTSRTCPAVKENTCYLPSPSAADAGYPLPSSTSTSPPTISSACPPVNEHTCFVPLPSVANTALGSFSSAAEQTTGRARADTTESDLAGSILAGSGLSSAVVSPTPVVVTPEIFETLSLGEVAPERLLSRVESRLPLSQGLAGMEAIGLDLSDGVTGGQLETSESGYDGDDDDDDDDGDNDDARSGSLSIKGVFLDSSKQQEEEEAQEMEEEAQMEEDIKTISLADGAIGGKLRTIGSDDDNDGNDVRYLGSNMFAVLFESSDEEEEEQEDGMESIILADKAMEGELRTIGSDDDNDDNDAKDAPHVSNNRFAVLFESSEEDEEEEGERQVEEGEWGDIWGDEWDKEEEEEEEEDEPKEEKEARQMEMEDDEAQEMQEKWREIDEEWEAMEEWVEEEEEEEEEEEQESVDH